MTTSEWYIYTMPQVPAPFKLLYAINSLWGGGGSDPGQAYDPTNSKAVYAESLRNVTATYLANQHTNAANSEALMNAANYLFDRKAETAAKSLYDNQTAAGTPHTYDKDYVLRVGQVDRNATAFVYQIIANYNSIFNGYANLGSQFTGTYSGMSWGPYSGSNNVLSSSTEYPEMYVSAGLKIDCGVGQYVYLPEDSRLLFVPQYGVSSGSVVITSPSGAVVYNQTMSSIGAAVTAAELTNEVGRYNINATGVHVFTTCAAKTPSSSATLSAAVLITVPNGDSMEVKGLCYASGSDYVWTSRTVSSASATAIGLNFRPGAPMGDELISLVAMMSDISAAISRMGAMLTEASNFGQSYFNSIVASGGGTILPAPDIVFPDPSQMANMTQEQISAVYFAYLNQLKDYFYTHTGTFDLSDVNISSVSLDLTCRGSIYDNNGNLLYDNLTVFTPFNSLKPITLRIGANTMDQPGFAVIWGRSASITGSYSASGGTYLELKEGYVLNIEQMFYKGEAVTEKTLDITTIDYVVSPNANIPKSPQGITDAQWLINHWYWFVIAFGAVLLAAGAFTRNWIFAIIGLIMVAVGGIAWFLVDAGTTTGLLSGLFQIRRGS